MARMKMTDERSLYAPLIQYANKEGWGLYRIEDAGANKKPFDIGGIAPDGRGVALEVKFAEKEVKNPFSLCSQHQIDWLKKFAESGGIGIIMIYLTVTARFQMFVLYGISDSHFHERFVSITDWMKKV